MPTDVLSDIPALRELIVAYVKQRWRDTHQKRKRLPKGFERSLSFDLVAIEDGSAIPVLEWNRDSAQVSLPGFTEVIEDLVTEAYRSVTDLIASASQANPPPALPASQLRALNKLGAGLRADERIEFLDGSRISDPVVYLDVYQRRRLLTRSQNSYQTRIEGIGVLVGTNMAGFVEIKSADHGTFKVQVERDRVFSDFDGNLQSEVQYSLQVDLDNSDVVRSVIEVFEFEIVQSAYSRVIERILSFAELKPGWNDGQGVAVSALSVDSAARFVGMKAEIADALRAYPTIEGGVLIEAERNGWDISIEFGPSGAIELYGIKIDGPEDFPAAQFSSLGEELSAAFDAAARLSS